MTWRIETSLWWIGARSHPPVIVLTLAAGRRAGLFFFVRSRIMTHTLACRRSLPLVVLALLSTALASPAHAQLGALRRAAERRVEQKAEDKVTAATLIPPTFDATTIELTAERLDRYAAAMETRKAAMAGNRQRYEALQAEASTLREAAQRAENIRERDGYDRASERYQDCRGDVVSAMESDSEQQMEALSQRIMTNPVAAQRDPKMKQISAAISAMGAAQQSGDTAAIRRATERMGALMGIAIDSATIDRKAAPKCGARPVKPRSMVVRDSLSSRAQTVSAEANALMRSNGGVKGSEVGMTDVQARMMWERIQSWLNGVQDSAPITRTFTKAEYDLLLARRGALRKAFANAE